MSDEETEILTGDVTITVYDGNEEPVRNARVSLSKNNTKLYSGHSDNAGECLIEDVAYDTYTLTITKPNYETYNTDLTVDDETIIEEVTLTHQPVDPNFVEVDMDESYLFTITEQLQRDYGFSHQIITWLQANMQSLVDDYNHPIFGKVNLGFSEESLRTFGKKPVCDVYLNGVEYTGDFDNHYPSTVKTIVLFYFKGANSPVYLKATELHDLVMQKFLTEEGFQRLPDIVRETYVTNSEIRIQPIQKKWGVMGAFELTHHLY